MHAEEWNKKKNFCFYLHRKELKFYQNSMIIRTYELDMNSASTKQDNLDSL